MGLFKALKLIFCISRALRCHKWTLECEQGENDLVCFPSMFCSLPPSLPSPPRAPTPPHFSEIENLTITIFQLKTYLDLTRFPLPPHPYRSAPRTSLSTSPSTLRPAQPSRTKPTTPRRISTETLSAVTLALSSGTSAKINTVLQRGHFNTDLPMTPGRYHKHVC